MFEESYQITSEFLDLHFKTILNIFEFLTLIEVLGASLALKINEPLSIKSLKSFFGVKSLRSICERSWTQFF